MTKMLHKYVFFYILFKFDTQIMTGKNGNGFKRFIWHQNCTEQCPEYCPEDGWTIEREDGLYYNDIIRIKCGKK